MYLVAERGRSRKALGEAGFRAFEHLAQALLDINAVPSPCVFL